MLGFLDTKVTLRHLLILGVIVAVPSMGAGALAAGVSLNGQFSAGSVRMSSASSHTSVAVNGLDSPKRILQAPFKVPAGKKADVQATFSGLLTHQTDVSGSASCSASFTVDHAPPDSQFNPGLVQLLGGSSAVEPDSIGSSFSGYRLGVGPGSHTVNVYLVGQSAGCIVWDRTLNVLINIH